MQLQMTTDYALRILVYLAEQNRVVPSTELAEMLVISHKYVLQIGRKLKEEQLVDTVAGSKGGYTLSRPPEEVSVYDVLVAMEGTIKFNRCLESDGFCSRNATAACMVHHLFGEAQRDFETRMKSETLASLLAKSKNMDRKERGRT